MIVCYVPHVIANDSKIVQRFLQNVEKSTKVKERKWVYKEVSQYDSEVCFYTKKRRIHVSCRNDINVLFIMI